MFQDGDFSVRYEGSAVRDWLNTDFAHTTFSEEELNGIETSMVADDGNSLYGICGGGVSNDKLFLLSIEEAEELWGSDEERKAVLSPDLPESGIDNPSSDSCLWWLRTPGNTEYSFAVVFSDGSVCQSGYHMNSEVIAVRPALWIDRKRV